MPKTSQKLGHPSPYTPVFIPLFAKLLDGCRNVLDPFAGIGRIHDLRQHIQIETVGVELEPEWATQHPDTLVGDATALPFGDDHFAAICTSPCYGNRAADSHNAQDGSHRQTYRHMLGRELTANNAGAMQWGARYRSFHEEAWEEAARVLEPKGKFILNISDHIRGGERMPVSEWHAQTLIDLGFSPIETISVATPRMRYGANATVRVDNELVIAFRGPHG